MSARPDTLAFNELITVLQKAEQRMLQQCNLTEDAEIADAYKNITDILTTALMFYTQNDSDRPGLMQVIEPRRKFGGDNADAIYHYAPLNGASSYKMTVDPGGACYFALTVYGGSEDSINIISNISLVDLKPNDNGLYEIEFSQNKTSAAPNHVLLTPDSDTLVTREYFFDLKNDEPVKLTIEPLGNPSIPGNPSGASVAKGLRAASRFIKGWTELTPMQMPDQLAAYNSVCPPFRAVESTTHWTTPDAVHAFGFYQLAEDEALLLHGRSPGCIYWGCNLWTPCMRTYDFQHHSVALNSAATHYEEDGSWKIVVAHRDPGMPNWIQTQGHPRGFIYFRWFLCEALPPAMDAKVIKLADSKAITRANKLELVD